MNLKTLSLRTKFLIIVSVLLLVAIFSYLSIAVSLFNQDKLAYIYDSNASLTKSLAGESQTLLEDGIMSVQAIASSAKKSRAAFSDEIFRMKPNLVYVEVYNSQDFLKNKRNARSIYNRGKTAFLEPYNTTPAVYQEIMEQAKFSPAELKQSRYQIMNLSQGKEIPLITVAALVRSEGSEVDDLIALAHLRSDKILDIFSQTDLYHTFLIQNSGKILVQNKDADVTQFQDQSILSQLEESQIKSGVLTYAKGDSEYILSYSRIDQLGIVVLSEISTDIAFMASKRLIEKSVQFAFLIFFVSLIVSFISTKQVTAALRILYKGTQKIADGDFSTKVPVTSSDEIGYLSKSFNFMSEKIVSLLDETKQQAERETEIKKDLATAQTVQDTFFANEVQQIGPLTVSGCYQPATQCGGDWWGCVDGPDNSQYIFIADAMGHGVSAALVTAMAYSACQTLSELIRNRTITDDSPGKILEEFNKVLYNAVKGEISMTFFAIKIDANTGTMTYANAGHNFPILFPTDKDDSRAGRVAKSMQKISDRPPINLNLKGTPLGVRPDSKYPENEIQIAAGDKIFLFTDGIIECTNPDGEVWGRKTLIKNILGIVEKNPADLQDDLLKQAFDFFDGQPLDDDLTVVVVEVDKHYQPVTARVAS
ncbi:SpoIIE family protein phosphatase [Oligoflexaceae bacterium]|nr:SpoIIE family protein phosphatase [Oligoflexaceae bacterium]